VRRSAILSTVIIAYFITGDKPNRSGYVSIFLVTAGAFLAASETLETGILGFLLTWAYNFSHSY